MNRVSRRASALVLLILFMLGGMGFFLYEYFTKADGWVVSVGSPHVYNSANIGCGQVVDRQGRLLLDMTSSRTYSDNQSTRLSTLHWLGDRSGNISAPAISHYAKEMTGYSFVDGLYSYDGTGGEATLTISAQIQNVALEAMGKHKGTIGVYNYKTGEILCAVTTPTYDPDNVPDINGDESGAYTGVYLNRFIQSAYVPGSIFKVVTTAAALDSVSGIAQMSFKCTGTYDYGAHDVTCERTHGKVDLKQALANSCNCAFAQIVELIGKSALTDYVDKFQVTKKLSFDGITTAAGNFDISNATAVEQAWAGIGQYTDLVNPCRFMTFMGAIANGGKAAEPYLVAAVESDGEVTYQASTSMTGRIMSQDVAEILKGYMRNNVVTNYGKSNFPGLTVCAKSGTSQLGGDQASNAMFAGFVADEEYPLAFMVVVENGGYGAATCVPILSKVLSACKTLMDSQ